MDEQKEGAMAEGTVFVKAYEKKKKKRKNPREKHEFLKFKLSYVNTKLFFPFPLFSAKCYWVYKLKMRTL